MPSQMEYISGFQNDGKNPDSFIVMIIIIVVVIAKEVKKILLKRYREAYLY